MLISSIFWIEVNIEVVLENRLQLLLYLHGYGSKKISIAILLKCLDLCSSLLGDKMSLLMMENPDLSTVFCQIYKNPCLQFNSSSSSVTVLVFTNFSILKGFSLLQSQVYFKVVIGLSISKGCSTNLRDGETILCQDSQKC